MVKVGINGFGRIGRLVLRAAIMKEGGKIDFYLLIIVISILINSRKYVISNIFRKEGSLLARSFV